MNNLYSLKKGSLKLKEFLKKFKGLCDKLTAIGKPMLDEDQVFQMSRALGSKYSDFKMAMLTKPPYPSIKQFTFASQNHKQVIVSLKEKESVNHNEAFFG